MMKFILLIFIVLSNFALISAVTPDLSDQVFEIIRNSAITQDEKNNLVSGIGDKAVTEKQEKVVLICADYFYKIDKNKAVNFYRIAGKLSLSKKNYNVLFSVGKNLSYLINFDEGELYMYWGCRIAMHNADWFFILNVCRRFVAMERFDSAEKWLERAGYLARRRKAVNGLHAISNIFKIMGYKYRERSLYYYQAARILEKEQSGIQY